LRFLSLWKHRLKKDGSADLCCVEEVARFIGRNLDGYKVIVTKSTVPVGTGRRIQQIIREENGNGSLGVFDVASNPEFFREGSAVEDFLRPNRVVIGAAILRRLPSSRISTAPFISSKLLS
jgi:UDPglucose 6-dehydrogenase